MRLGVSVPANDSALTALYGPEQGDGMYLGYIEGLSLGYKREMTGFDDTADYWPNPASRARMTAWTRSATCSLLKMLET